MKIKVRKQSIVAYAMMVMFLLIGFYRYTENVMFIELKNLFRQTFFVIIIAFNFPYWKKVRWNGIVISALAFGFCCVVTLCFTNSVKFPLLTEVLFWPVVLWQWYRIVQTSDWRFSDKMIKRCGSLILVLCFLLILNRNHDYRFYTQSLYHAYYAITFMPFILLLDKKSAKYRMIYIILTVILVLLSAKRGGLIALAAGMIAYYATNVIVEEGFTKKAKRLSAIAFVGVVLLGVFNVLSQYSGLDIFLRLQDISFESGSSGRNYIWEAIFDAYESGTVLQQTFGFGFDATYDVTANVAALSTMAHNDFIGIMFNYGKVSLVAIVIFIILFGMKIIVFLHTRNTLAPIYTYIFVVVGCFSMISSCLSSSEIVLFIAAFIGMTLGEEENRKENRIV